jgi:hypothetical protein
MKRDPNKYPKGWNRKRVEAVIKYYDREAEEGDRRGGVVWRGLYSDLRTDGVSWAGSKH